MNLMKYKRFYFIFSVIIMLPGIYYLVTSGLKFGIDFTGGALLEYKFQENVNVDDLKTQVSNLGIDVGQIQSSGNNTYLIRTKPLNQEQINSIKSTISTKYSGSEEQRVENVGPVIGNELKQKSLIALGISSLAIVLYIAFSFRKVPKPTSSWRFGVSAIIALLHDVLIVIGAFAILGYFFHVEVDTLFVTAVLTIIGFSVHDTIVVFDRIRENLLKNVGRKFNDIADVSVIQTLARSLNTSLTVVFVLLALLLFGGESIRWFVVALLIGVISGTYSSIFNATALLAWWEEKFCRNYLKKFWKTILKTIEIIY